MTLTTTATMFTCPVCGEPLVLADQACRCGNGHCFDVAREGYVNLLLPQHRRSKDPGYSKGMIVGRRDFFDAGHYEPLADGIADLVRDYLPGDDQRHLVVDAGCGEGYYLRRLRALLRRAGIEDKTLLCGLDISKHGIRIAARRDPAGTYAVASTYRVPLPVASTDVLLTHFSPVSAEEFRRVVKPGGVVLVGGPAEGHLFAFKQLLYDAPERHAPQETLTNADGFALVDTHSIRYPLSLRGPGQVANLLLMTPFYWSVSEATQARLAGMDALDTEVDVVVHAYRRLDGPIPADTTNPAASAT